MFFFILFLQNDSIDSSSSSDTGGESNSHKIRRMRPRPHFKGGQRQSLSGRKMSTPGVSTNYSMTCLERLIRTHPIWFLPKINRDEASEFLAGKESGVRKYAIYIDASLLLEYVPISAENYFDYL